MGDILFLAHRMPFPPDRGDRIRSHNLLKALDALAPVHVGCFADNEDERRHMHRLARWSDTQHVELRRKPMAIAGAQAFMALKPVSLTAFASNTMHEWVASLCRTRTIDAIVIFSGQMGQYVPPDYAGRVIVDLCDVDSAKFEAYSERGWLPKRWIYAREGRLLACEEERLCGRADETLFISEAERDLFLSRQIGAARRSVRVLPNGVDTDYFDPAKLPSSDKISSQGQPRLVFTGQMDYPPNITAAERIIERLLPNIRMTYPDASFHCVGRSPAACLTRHHGKAGVHVWGEVADMRPFLAAADIVVAPLEIARGVQNKVLEAMAMARPVVLSREAATGIEAKDGRDYMIGEDDGRLIDAILSLSADPDRAATMGRSARDFVIAERSWTAAMQPLAALCGFGKEGTAAQPKRDAA